MTSTGDTAIIIAALAAVIFLTCMAACCKWGVCCKQLRQEEREQAAEGRGEAIPNVPHPDTFHPHPLHLYPQGTDNQTYRGHKKYGHKTHGLDIIEIIEEIIE